MKMDEKKLDAAIENSRYTKRQIYGSFGGRRRVENWFKQCNPSHLGGVARALGVKIATLLVEETSVSVADAVTVEVVPEVVEAEEITQTVSDAVEAVVDAVVVAERLTKAKLKRLSNEKLIVMAHSLDPDVDLPDDATKKELIEIIEGL